MTIEENAAYYNMVGKNKYYEVDEDIDFHVTKQKSKASYEFRHKNKGISPYLSNTTHFQIPSSIVSLPFSNLSRLFPP